VAYAFKNIRVFREAKSIADGATDTIEIKFNVDGALKHILIKADGAAPSKSTATVVLGNENLTISDSMANTWGTSIENAVLLDMPVKSGTILKVGLKNLEGAAKEFSVEAIVDAT